VGACVCLCIVSSDSITSRQGKRHVAHGNDGIADDVSRTTPVGCGHCGFHARGFGIDHRYRCPRSRNRLASCLGCRHWSRASCAMANSDRHDPWGNRRRWAVLLGRSSLARWYYYGMAAKGAAKPHPYQQRLAARVS